MSKSKSIAMKLAGILDCITVIGAFCFALWLFWTQSFIQGFGFMVIAVLWSISSSMADISRTLKEVCDDQD